MPRILMKTGNRVNAWAPDELSRYMEKSDFDNLMERYLAGQVSEKERMKIEAWLDVIRSENPAGLDLTRAEENKLFHKITSNLDNLEEVKSFRPERMRKLSPSQWILRIAASLSLISLLSYAVWMVADRDEHGGGMASKEEINKIILNDGSLVWLRGDSKLAYFEKKDEGIRYGELTGEALFEVAKDPDHPFIVRCGNVSIKVLGTSFNIKAGNGQLELKVLTGKVSLITGANPEGIVVEANEQVTMTTNAPVVKHALEEEEIETIIKNTEYDMQFRGTSLGEVLDRMENKFNVNIILADKEAAKCGITADFTDHSLESSLQIIAEVLDVDYARNGKTITLTGVGCP